MKYFTKADDIVFEKEPCSFDKYTSRDVLKYAVGANMYMPATQKDVFEKLIQEQLYDVGAITLCMEDAIQEEDLEQAEKNALDILEKLYEGLKKNPKLNLPLIFIRVRSGFQFCSFSKMLEKKHLKALAGFAFPKFSSLNGDFYFKVLERLAEKYGETLYGMPIIEETSVIYKETRLAELHKIQNILIKYDAYVLNIRVGGTDFSSVYSLRRSADMTIYDIRVVADCLSDIANFFLRKECGYVVSGPVWEYFSYEEDSIEVSGLKKELHLDIQNGFHGKTIIHPSQVDVVNRAYIVSYTDYMDAVDILNRRGGGVSRSHGGNRMNEANPHRNWAESITAKAAVFGVMHKY